MVGQVRTACTGGEEDVNLLPVDTRPHPDDGGLVDAVNDGEFLGGLRRGSNRGNTNLGELGTVVVLARGESPLSVNLPPSTPRHVVHVLSARTNRKMRRVNTSPHMARVSYVQSFWDRTDEVFVGEAVGANVSLRPTTSLNASVPGVVERARPQPTSVSSFDLLVPSLKERANTTHRTMVHTYQDGICHGSCHHG